MDKPGYVQEVIRGQVGAQAWRPHRKLLEDLNVVAAGGGGKWRDYKKAQGITSPVEDKGEGKGRKMPSVSLMFYASLLWTRKIITEMKRNMIKF